MTAAGADATATEAVDGVVVGVGNPTRGDDGVGRAVVRATEGVPATFASTTAFFALEAAAGRDRAVIVDAVDADGPPGTIHRYRLDAGREAVPQVALHDVTFADALSAGRGVYDLPDRLVLLGVVPGSLATEIELSDPVRRAVPATAALARAELVETTPYDGGDTTVDTTWYCQDCGEQIDATTVSDHERRGHSVHGRARPDRLLSEDPWELGDGEERADTGTDATDTTDTTAATDRTDTTDPADGGDG